MKGHRGPFHRHLRRNRPPGEWGVQLGLKWLPVPSTEPCSLWSASLCSFSSQGFSWGDSLFLLLQGCGLHQQCPHAMWSHFCSSTILLLHLVSLSQSQIPERRNPVGVTWVVSFSGPVAAAQEPGGGSVVGGEPLWGHRWEAMVGVGYNVRHCTGDVCVTRAAEESNDRCVFLL